MSYDPERPVRIGTRLKALPVCVIDFETTGIDAKARAVEVGLARFEGPELVSRYTTRINPGAGVEIPEEASKIHGIWAKDVEGKPSIQEVFSSELVRSLLRGAAPCAYNAPFDHRFMPWDVLTEVLAPTWPWLDGLVMVRALDRFVKGPGRHKLDVTCKRHGVELLEAHSALADTTAAGHLLFKLAGKLDLLDRSAADVLLWSRKKAADQWHDFESYLATQRA